MARVWLARREGRRLLGTVVADRPLEELRSLLDLAPWRWYADSPPEEVSRPSLDQEPEHVRVLAEITEDQEIDSTFHRGRLYESPWSPAHVLSRLQPK